MSGHLRGNLFFLHSWLHSCTKLSHLCRLTQAFGRSPDSSTGCWCQTTTGQQCRESQTLRQDRWYRRGIWALQPPPFTAGPHSAGYVGELQTHLLCNTFFPPPPTRSAATELVRDLWSANADLASSLLPWMKKVIITLAVNEEDEGLELARNRKAHVIKQRYCVGLAFSTFYNSLQSHEAPCRENLSSWNWCVTQFTSVA